MVETGYWHIFYDKKNHGIYIKVQHCLVFFVEVNIVFFLTGSRYKMMFRRKKCLSITLKDKVRNETVCCGFIFMHSDRLYLLILLYGLFLISLCLV
jgi:hypothetical protein